jgi:hypothetical protein
MHVDGQRQLDDTFVREVEGYMKQLEELRLARKEMEEIPSLEDDAFMHGQLPADTPPDVDQSPERLAPRCMRFETLSDWKFCSRSYVVMQA